MIKLILNAINKYEDQIKEYFAIHPKQFLTFFLVALLIIIVFLILYVLFAGLLLKINHSVFKRVEKKRGKTMHLHFLEQIIKIAIIVIFIIIPLAGDSIERSVLGSAAVATAVIGFAAQDIIRDVLSGILFLLQGGLFALGWLFGRQIIPKEKTDYTTAYNRAVLCFVLGLVMFIPLVFIVGAGGGG